MQKINAIVFAAALLAFATAGAPAGFAQELIDGQITKVDEPAGKVTIRHGPIRKFDMDDGMTMIFRVADPAMLKAVKPGDKVKFDTDKINGRFTVTKIEKVK